MLCRSAGAQMLLMITVAGGSFGRATHKPVYLFCHPRCNTGKESQVMSGKPSTCAPHTLILALLTPLTARNAPAPAGPPRWCSAAGGTAPSLTPFQLSRTTQHPLAAPADASAGRPGVGAGRRRRNARQRGRHRRGRRAHVGLGVGRGHCQPAHSAPLSQRRTSSATRDRR